MLDGRGVKVEKYPEGFYLGPTIFDDVSPDMAIAREEVFGPVASIIHAETIDDAIEIINNSTGYGNMACIFTTNGRNAKENAEESTRCIGKILGRKPPTPRTRENGKLVVEVK